MEMLTTKQKVANAIKWIDGLKYYKKTTGRLGKMVDGQMKYCCLGVGCKVLNLHKDKDFDFDSGESYTLKGMVGLITARGSFYNSNTGYNSLVYLNDETYENDKGFKNIRKEIFEHLDDLFEMEVAQGLKKHYKIK